MKAPTADPAEAAILLRDAAAHITQRGWCQNTIEDDDGRLCMLGAMTVAGYRRHHLDKCLARGTLLQVLDENYGIDMPKSQSSWSISGFNDKRMKSEDEAIAMFEKAAIRLEEGVTP